MSRLCLATALRWQPDERIKFELNFRNFLMSGSQEKTRRWSCHAPATRSRYVVQVDHMKETRKLAEDGDEVAKRFMRLSGEEQRAQMVGTDELGGYTVPDSDMGLLETALLRYNSIMQAGPRMFNTSATDARFRL